MDQACTNEDALNRLKQFISVLFTFIITGSARSSMLTGSFLAAHPFACQVLMPFELDKGVVNHV